MRDAQETVLYVGKAKNLKHRLHSYRVANPDRLARRHLRLLRAVARIELIECADEAAALAKEAELLLALKPAFNRAGVWPALPRFLVWRGTDQSLELAISETPTSPWQVFGPFGSGASHLRAALARLLWYARYPDSGSATMPEGWLHGRLGTIAAIPHAPGSEASAAAVLAQLFSGETDGFTTWISNQTATLARPHDQAIREADLETVLQFVAAKARRTRPFSTPAQSAPREPADVWLFADEPSQHP